ncbi:MAG: NUDIX hydrolase [Bdellovibrionales bacterium]|nr:NUDIX hydrolase [Bdellovibrionales bacterium]
MENNKHRDKIKKISLIETTISSSIAYSGNFLKVTLDEVLLPNKSLGTREYILHPGASLTIPLLSDGRVVMIEQYRHAVKKVFLEFPAGKKDPGESFEKTARRELSEETGYDCARLEFLTTIHPVIGYSDEEIQIYLAEDLTKNERNLDHDEFVNIVELTLPELARRVRAGEVSDVKTQIAFFWLEKRVKGDWI